MRKKKIQILLSAAAFLFLMGGTMPSVAQERKIGRIERRADRNFIRQKFDKAMAQYETAIRREKDEDSQAALHLKTARLYFMVREYGRASEHYDKAMGLRPDLLGVDDVCDYIDALRFQGQARKAEAICLDNAYKDIYSRYQRYQNTLEALAMRHSVQEDPGFSAKRLSLNTPNAEFGLEIMVSSRFMPLATVNSMIRESCSFIVLTIMHLTKPVPRLRNLRDIMDIFGRYLLTCRMVR